MRYHLILLCFILLSCAQGNQQDSGDVVRFEELVNIDGITEIRVWNNNGEHEVLGDNRAELIEKLGEMTLDTEGSYKLGGKAIELTISGEKFMLWGKTNGSNIEVDHKIVTINKDRIEGLTTLYFNTNNLNIDNF